ncbi:MAG: hypothetical protein IH914_09795, partial [candidate division Zixibacteria bacterium]|nr:hypothetical protein [candidate division Zixibacteria bacterium]
MKDTRMKFPPAYSRHLKTRLQRFLLAGLLLAALLPASLLGREYRFVYYEAGPYPVSRTLQGEYRDEVRRLAPEGMEIVYPPNGYMSANWDREKCRKMAKQISRDKKFDLVVAMGPWTVEDLIEAGCKKPIVSMGRFDPILEGIADSKGRPKYKNLTVRIRPGKVESDLQALTTVFKAKRIGLLYFPTNTEFDTVEKYIRKQAAKVGATIVAVPPDPKKAIYQFFKKTKGLARKIDALYLTPLFGLDLNAMNAFFTHLEREGIPAFSSEGFFQVERGAFASNTAAMISGVARYHADKTIRILQGASPASLPTVFRDGRRLSLNLPAYQKAGQ